MFLSCTAEEEWGGNRLTADAKVMTPEDVTQVQSSKQQRRLTGTQKNRNSSIRHLIITAPSHASEAPR